jgi:hypothetical protein
MKTGIDGKRGKKVQNVRRGERGNRAHVERMRCNERERERKEREEILSRRKGNRMDERDMEE